MEAIEMIKERRSVREFQAKRVDRAYFSKINRRKNALCINAIKQ